MRELPEFQVLANEFNNLFNGRILKEISVLNTKKIKDQQEELNKRIAGNLIDCVYRYGKDVHFKFSNKEVLGINLRLHGKLVLFENSNRNDFTLVELYFENGKGLALTDRQSNATIKLNPAETDGVDALSNDLHTFLLSALQSRAKIKSLITNQNIIRGIGNIYADEILWEARISPFSVAGAIPEFKIKALANAIKKVLINAEKEIINRKIKVFFENRSPFLKIHGKQGEYSPTGSIIKVVKKAGHSTYYSDEQVLYN